MELDEREIAPRASCATPRAHKWDHLFLVVTVILFVLRPQRRPSVQHILVLAPAFSYSADVCAHDHRHGKSLQFKPYYLDG
jgi:hypothetical protein